MRFSNALLLIGMACANEPEIDAGGGAQDASTDLGGTEDASPGRDLSASFDAPGASDSAVRPLDHDGDGLTDRIDPTPRIPNAQLYSDDFESVGSDWLFSSVAMRIEPMSGVLAVPLLEPFEREGWIGPRPTWSDYLVQARLRVISVGRSQLPGAGRAGVVIRAEQVTPSRYVACELDLGRRQVLLVEHVGTRRKTLAQATSPVDLRTWATVTLLARQSNYTCDVAGVVLGGQSTLLIGGSVGFRSLDATFEADWVRAYEL